MNQADSSSSIRDLGESIRADFIQLGEAAEQQSRQLVEQLRTWVIDHPLTAVGAAFGVGFALSGGIVSRNAMRLLGWGGRLYARKTLSDLVERGFQQVMGMEQESVGVPHRA